VAFGIAQSKDLSELTLEQLQSFSELIEQDVFEVLTLEGSLNARDHLGGTAPRQVLIAAGTARSLIDARPKR
jgi:argininosuccinate lyase